MENWAKRTGIKTDVFGAIAAVPNLLQLGGGGRERGTGLSDGLACMRSSTCTSSRAACTRMQTQFDYLSCMHVWACTAHHLRQPAAHTRQVVRVLAPCSRELSCVYMPGHHSHGPVTNRPWPLSYCTSIHFIIQYFRFISTILFCRIFAVFNIWLNRKCFINIIIFKQQLINIVI